MAKPLMCDRALFTKDLKGKVYIVTGGNSGIGKATVGQLAKQGATVVMACRRMDAAHAAAEELRTEGLPAHAAIVPMALDLAELASVRAFASAFTEQFSRLDALINNAGVMNAPRGTTVDGFEMQFGVNHCGHFLLTALLIEVLKASAPARIVCVSSLYHDVAVGRRGRIDFDDLHFERRKYDGWKAYAQSKLANVLHAKELARRLEGSGVLAFSLHPGWVQTDLVRHTTPVWMQNLSAPLLRMVGMIKPWAGAQTTLHCVLSDNMEPHTGAYFSQTGPYPQRHLRKGAWPMVSPNKHVHDPEVARRLFDVTQDMVNAPPL